MTSYWRSTVTTALSHVVSEILNVEKCRDLEIRVRGHSRSLKVDHSIDWVRLVFYSNFVPKRTVFLDIWLVSMPWPWNPGLGSLQVIENDIIRPGTHDFLLTFHSNHGPISHRFLDKRQFQSKIANFSHPRVFRASNDGVPLGIGYRCKGSKTRVIGLPDGQKSLKIGLVDKTQYRRVTDRQTDTGRQQVSAMHICIAQ